MHTIIPVSRKTRLLALAVTTLLAAGCAQDTNTENMTQEIWEDNEVHTMGNENPVASSVSLGVSFNGLEPLGDDFLYEGWVITDDGPVSTGRFQIDEDGAPTTDSFAIDQEIAESATLFVLTIEPAFNDDPAPTAVHLLAGEILDGSAELTIGHPAALATDFADAEGMFILKTPTTGDTDEDDSQGIWWVDPAAGPGPTLTLPALPEGWVYEGWVVGSDGPISTGTFFTSEQADSDGAGPDAGPDGAPPFPGQDFIWPVLDLIGFKAVITVEPQPDNDPHPFLLKPLLGEIEDVGGGVLQPMWNQAADAAAPTGQAWFFMTENTDHSPTTTNM